MLTAAPRIAKLLPRLASNHDAEVVATARAIERTLRASGADWHDLAREIQQPEPVPALPQRAPRARRERTHRTPRAAPIAVEVLRLLRFGLAHDVFSVWERDFADTILIAAGRPGWRPSKKQAGIIARLVNQAQEAERHP